MDVSFYTAAVGAAQQQGRLDIHANNLANVNNDRFHARRPSFAALMTGPIPGIEEELARGVGARLDSAESDPKGDMMEPTDRALDYAIVGDGFFGLVDPATGEFSYTRDGGFILTNMQEWVMPEPREPELDENGEPIVLLDEDGEPIVEPEPEPTLEYRWYLSDGFGRLVLGEDGRPVSVEDPVADIQMGDPLPIGIFDFENYNGMISLEQNRYVPVEKNGEVRLGTGKLSQGALELSNTDVGFEFTKVIETQRTFSMLLRMVQTSDEITQTVNGLRR